MKDKTKISMEFPLQEELIDLIKKQLTLHSLYVISVKKETQQQNVYLSPQAVTFQSMVAYTLLIVTYKPISKNLGDFMDDLYNKMQKRCKVCVITFTLSKVKKHLNYGSNFLSQAIFKTSCIYKEDDSLSKFSGYPLHLHQFVFKRIQETWKTRMNRAEYMLSILNTIIPEEDSISRLSIMHYALEQICMGLLYVFWEFKPQHYSLSYMLHLCRHFSQLPETIFPKETYGLHRMYYMLCNAHHIIRFKVQNEFSKEDTDKAYNRCDRFYEEAKLLGDSHLNTLKHRHCQSSV